MSSSTDPMVLYGQYLTLDSDEFRFSMERDDVDTNLTFSQEALHQIVQSINVFLGARICAHFEKTGIAPKKMTVDISISLG